VRSLLHPLRIGSLYLENNLALAPMSDTTDRSFRVICREFGAGLTLTGLVSAKGICHDPGFRRSWSCLAIDPAELPAGIQLFGSEPADFVRAIQQIQDHPLLSQCGLIDLNMGCPVAKVVKTGSGAALMLDPARAGQIIRACVQEASAFGKPVTVKFRKGWDEASHNAADFARMCEDAGAAALTVHGRTRVQMYSGQADWQIIGEVKAAVGIPVYGNGDVQSAETAAAMIRSTGADGVMVGRATRGRPWIFREIAAGLAIMDGSRVGPLPEEPALAEKSAIVIRHMDGLVSLMGEAAAIREMRGQLVWYFKGTPGGSELKNLAMKARTREEILAVLEVWHRDGMKSCENS
jgi:tRNA-dihydrouridine synthase B